MRHGHMPDDNELLVLPALPADFKDAAALVQAQFKESIKSLDNRIEALRAEHQRRKVVAVALKVISVLSSLIIATGFLASSVAQVLGGIITGMAALERVFANVGRLLAVAAAEGAYERVRRQIVSSHNQKIVDIVKIRDREPEKSADLLIASVGSLRDELARMKNEIETQLDNNAYENLGRLTLDEPHGKGAPV
jgi:hypothetical protein